MTNKVVIIDYGSGNLRSAEKAFMRAASDAGITADVVVSNNPADVLSADRIVLPGVGAYGDCMAGLVATHGMIQALETAALTNQKPFLGICVGMQLMADEGREHGTKKGLGWLRAAVDPIEPKDSGLKIPHMGWNQMALTSAGEKHPVAGILSAEDHAYFVHSYHMNLAEGDALLATVNYGEPLTAIVGRDNILGFQFHPEKSQAVGLALITAFLRWQI